MPIGAVANASGQELGSVGHAFQPPGQRFDVLPGARVVEHGQCPIWQVGMQAIVDPSAMAFVFNNAQVPQVRKMARDPRL